LVFFNICEILGLKLFLINSFTWLFLNCLISLKPFFISYLSIFLNYTSIHRRRRLKSKSHLRSSSRWSVSWKFTYSTCWVSTFFDICNCFELLILNWVLDFDWRRCMINNVLLLLNRFSHILMCFDQRDFNWFVNFWFFFCVLITRSLIINTLTNI